MTNTNSTLSTLTSLEREVLSNLISQLYAEQGFSDVGCVEIANELKKPLNTIKGVVGSLTKKHIVSTENPSGKTGGDIIYLNTDFHCLHPQWCKDAGVDFVSLEEEESDFTITTPSDFSAATKQLQDSWVGDIVKHNPTFKAAAIKKHLLANNFTNVTYDDVYYSLQRVKSFQPEIDTILSNSTEVAYAFKLFKLADCNNPNEDQREGAEKELLQLGYVDEKGAILDSCPQHISDMFEERFC